MTVMKHKIIVVPLEPKNGWSRRSSKMAEEDEEHGPAMSKNRELQWLGLAGEEERWWYIGWDF
jgi:hypothetical protein